MKRKTKRTWKKFPKGDIGLNLSTIFFASIVFIKADSYRFVGIGIVIITSILMCSYLRNWWRGNYDKEEDKKDKNQDG